jgi:hypothetical protein
MSINSIEAYEDAGRKAGEARRNRDHSLAAFQHAWMLRATGAESAEDRKACRDAYEQAYRKAAGASAPPTHFG